VLDVGRVKDDIDAVEVLKESSDEEDENILGIIDPESQGAARVGYKGQVNVEQVDSC